MSLTALYVYAPTTFELKGPIEAISKEAYGPGTVQLAPGIYRFAPGTSVVPEAHANGADYQVIALGGTKKPWPDPPQRAQVELKQTKEDIQAFLNGAGETTRF